MLGKELRKLFLKVELKLVQQFVVGVTVDPGTAHPTLIVSNDGKQVYNGVGRKNRPES